jgi:hypothetical protein
MSPDSLMEIVRGRSMKQEALDAATRIENPRALGRGVRQTNNGVPYGRYSGPFATTQFGIPPMTVSFTLRHAFGAVR